MGKYLIVYASILISLSLGFSSGIFVSSVLQTPPVTQSPGTFLEDYDLLLISENKNTIFYFNQIKAMGRNDTSCFVNRNKTWETSPSACTDIKLDVRATEDSLNKKEYSVTLEFKYNGNTYRLNRQTINMGMTVRAGRDFSKFGGAISGIDLTAGKNQEKYFMAMLASFDHNYTEIDIEKIGIRTTWAMIADQNGNFYHLDKTEVKTADQNYGPHEFFGSISPLNNSVKYYSVDSLSSDKNLLITTKDGYPVNMARGSGLKLPYYKNAELYIINEWPEQTGTSDGTGKTGVMMRLDSINGR